MLRLAVMDIFCSVHAALQLPGSLHCMITHPYESTGFIQSSSRIFVWI